MNFRSRRQEPLFPWLLVAIVALMIVAAISVHGCATKPVGPTQTLYSAGWTLVGATNSVADLHDAGTLTGANYDKAKALLAQATAAYQTAKASLRAGKEADAVTYLTLLQSLLNQLAAYLTAHGGS